MSGCHLERVDRRFLPSMSLAGAFPVSECGMECCLNKNRDTLHAIVPLVCFLSAPFSSQAIRSAPQFLEGWYGALYKYRTPFNLKKLCVSQLEKAVPLLDTTKSVFMKLATVLCSFSITADQLTLSPPQPCFIVRPRQFGNTHS